MQDFSTLDNRRDFELVAANLAIGRGGRALVSGLNVRLEAGEALVVTGPNGAGKSTLLRTLAGLLGALAGEVSVSGSGLEAGLPAGACAHYLGHADGMKSALTVRENLEFWASMLGGAVTGLDIASALSAIGLPHVAEFPAGYLSAGQKRRVALARLLVAFRPLWLLDEPATALDAASQLQLADIMRGHLARGGIIIAATHMPLGLEGARQLLLTPEGA